MSMIRAAPTMSGWPPGLSVDWLYSSISSTYGCPCSVNGIAFCGMDAAFQVRRLISRAWGFDLRAWIWLVSRISMFLPVGSAMYARFPFGESDIPCDWIWPCQTAVGCLGFVTSTAVISWSAVAVA